MIHFPAMNFRMAEYEIDGKEFFLESDLPYMVVNGNGYGYVSLQGMVRVRLFEVFEEGEWRYVPVTKLV